MINEHNSQVTQSGYTLSENHLADWTQQEYSRIKGYRSSLTRQRIGSRQFPLIPDQTIIPTQYLPYTNTIPVSQLPATVNWTAQGFVNPVEDQGECGDCWAFSAAGALEGQYYNATRTPGFLSEQNLLDCSSAPPYNNSGCNGGAMVSAFQYVIDNKGIDMLVSYPYTGQQGPCRYSSSQSAGYVIGFKIVQEYNEAALQQAVALVGPISVGINAHLSSFQFYSGGVYKPSTCNPNQLDHAVLAVGYGTTSDGQDYWLLKNSWGTDWGIQGYMMLARNDNNLCGIATDASFPTVFVPSGITMLYPQVGLGSSSIFPSALARGGSLLVVTVINIVLTYLLSAN